MKSDYCGEKYVVARIDIKLKKTIFVLSYILKINLK